MKKIFPLIIAILLVSVAFAPAFADDFKPSDTQQNATNTMVLNADNTVGDVALQFGGTLNEYLKWNSTFSRFDLSDNLETAGSLTATGLTTTGNVTVSGAQILGGSPFVFEGATDNDITTTFTVTDPTASSKTITFPDASGTVAFTSDIPTEVYQPAQLGLHQADGTNNAANSWTEYNYTEKEQWNIISGGADGQDLDVVYQIMVPLNFTTWESTSLKIHYKVSDTNKNVTVYIYDTGGTEQTGGVTGNSGTEADITISNLTGTFTPGETFVILCKGNVDIGDSAYVGWIKGNYQ